MRRMRIIVAMFASKLARLLKSTTRGTFRRKKAACMTTPQRIVWLAMAASSGGRLRSRWKISASKGGRVRNICTVRSTVIIHVFRRMKER